MFKITSLQNPKIKDVVKLRERREREKTNLFLIEGYRELRRALDAKRKPHTLFYCPELFLGSNERALLDQSGAELIQCTPEVFAKISYRDRPDGLLAVAPQLHLALKDLPLKKNPFFVIAESIETTGHLG
ncbi:MAG TPA: RNA methyltransferase, partial [Parachlamydiales bacterium]|nr:RNA methyltransferase [Parachlamydiales bacterium]